MAKIYADELRGGGRAPSPQRVQLLEISQYLESYLWPHFDADSSTRVHVLSIAAMVNQKRREGVSPWDPFRAAGSEKFAGLFRRVVALDADGALTTAERTSRLVFLVCAFQSLEDEMVRGVALPMVSLPLWTHLAPGGWNSSFANPQLDKHWRHLMKKEARRQRRRRRRATPAPTRIDPRRRGSPRSWMISRTCESAVGEGDWRGDRAEVDAQAAASASVSWSLRLTCSRSFRPRRFVRTVLDDKRLLVKARMMRLHAHPAGRLYSQLVDLLAFYLGFEINDHTGAPLTDEDIASAHCDRILTLQRLCFKHIEKLRELALSHCAAIEKRDVLTEHLYALDEDELRHLATRQLRLVDPKIPGQRIPRFCWRRRCRPSMPLAATAINEMPLYPNEDVLWDENVVPSVTYTAMDVWRFPSSTSSSSPSRTTSSAISTSSDSRRRTRFERTSPTRCDASDRGATPRRARCACLVGRAWRSPSPRGDWR